MRTTTSIALAMTCVALAAACGDDSQTSTSTTGSGGSAEGGAGAGGAGPGGAGGQGGDDGPSAEQLAAMDRYHAVLCEGLETCSSILFAELFLDQAECIERFTESGARYVFAPGSNETPETLDACTDALVLPDCDAWYRAFYQFDQPPECFIYGERTSGDPCGSLNQCDTYVCSAPPGSCGECSGPLANEGEACNPESCNYPLACNGNTCFRFRDLGEDCSQFPCDSWLACIGGTCAGRLADGEVCDLASPHCEIDHACNQLTLVCEPFMPSALGDPCGLLADGTTHNCEYGARCKVDEGGDATCVPAIARGEPCNDTGYLFSGSCTSIDFCQFGVCVRNEPAVCD